MKQSDQCNVASRDHSLAESHHETRLIRAPPKSGCHVGKMDYVPAVSYRHDCRINLARDKHGTTGRIVARSRSVSFPLVSFFPARPLSAIPASRRFVVIARRRAFDGVICKIVRITDHQSVQHFSMLRESAWDPFTRADAFDSARRLRVGWRTFHVHDITVILRSTFSLGAGILLTNMSEIRA